MVRVPKANSMLCIIKVLNKCGASTLQHGELIFIQAYPLIQEDLQDVPHTTENGMMNSINMKWSHVENHDEHDKQVWRMMGI